MNILLAPVFAFVCGLSHCAPYFQDNSLRSEEGVAERAEMEIASRVENLPEAAELSWSTWHGTEEYDDYLMYTTFGYIDYDYEGTTELVNVDGSYCQKDLKDEFLDGCRRVFDEDYAEVEQIKNKREYTKGICCTLADYHDCIWKAYHNTNCVTDRAFLKENLKNSHSFFLSINNITTCSEIENQCTDNIVLVAISGADPMYTCYSIMFLVLIAILIAL